MRYQIWATRTDCPGESLKWKSLPILPRQYVQCECIVDYYVNHEHTGNDYLILPMGDTPDQYEWVYGYGEQPYRPILVRTAG